MSLVRVWTDIGGRKPVPLLAKIIERDGVIFTIRYLSESDDKIWRYEDETYEIDSDSIAEELNTSMETDLNFRQIGDGFIKVDSDEDYIPTSEDEESDEDTDEETDEETDQETDGEVSEVESDSDEEEYLDEE